jgi:hypothetical protein
MNTITKKWFIKMIESLENDYQFWRTDDIFSILDIEYYSPHYITTHDKYLYFRLNYGVVINEILVISFPLFLNPFSGLYWRYRKAKRNMKQYLNTKYKNDLLTFLEETELKQNN